MFDIMFMCQKQNKPRDSSRCELTRAELSMEQMRFLGHVNTKQRCEIQLL